MTKLSIETKNVVNSNYGGLGGKFLGDKGTVLLALYKWRSWYDS